MRLALPLAALIVCCRTTPTVAPCAQGASPQDFPLPADVMQQLTSAQQGVCEDAPHASTFAWWQNCDNRFRAMMAVHCVGAAETWCSAHCGSVDCGGALSVTTVGKQCARGGYIGFMSAMRYCSGLELKEDDRVLQQPDAGGPTCP